ncbi:hypothetical protein ACFPM7_20695 [Actinokineospora guangxiensis]|uniref:MYXO-CTERM domain-containing protein n=1 Tax=Actinokineospora guangxiensis TaxID=1490288 RepID=A0ABW0EPX9_9PSEU
MRSVVRWVVGAVLVVGGMGFGAGVAAAGGPTSALVTSPGEGWAVGLYYDDTEYTQLQALLDAGEEIAGEVAWEGDHLTVTWLVHDVHIWRTDRVLLDAAGGPVVETTTLMTESGVESVVRRKLAKPAQLTALVGAIGAQEGAGAGQGGATGAENAGSPDRAAGDGSAGDGSAGDGVVPAAQRTPLEGDVRWEWGIGGVVVGVLGAVLVGRARAVRAGR